MGINKMFKKTMKLKSVKSKPTFTLKKKSRTVKRGIKRYLSKSHFDEDLLRNFKVFFKAIIDIDDTDYDDEQRAKYDMKKDKILDKLDNIERKDPILRYIKVTSPDIYTKLGYDSINIPYLELIEVYYNILKKLETILYEDDSLSSEVSQIQSEILDNLVNNFIKKKNAKNVNSINDDLLDMFRGMGIKSDLDDLESLFKGMKVEL